MSDNFAVVWDLILAKVDKKFVIYGGIAIWLLMLFFGIQGLIAVLICLATFAIGYLEYSQWMMFLRQQVYIYSIYAAFDLAFFWHLLNRE